MLVSARTLLIMPFGRWPVKAAKRDPAGRRVAREEGLRGKVILRARAARVDDEACKLRRGGEIRGMSALRLRWSGWVLAVLVGAGMAQRPLGAAQLLETAPEPPWQALFEGKFPIQFRGYKMQEFPFDLWSARAGVLATVPGNDRADLLIRQPCTNFEFSVEYRLGPGASSGILYLVQEGPTKASNAGLKLTLADNEGLAEARNSPLFRTGALYGLLPAKVVRLKTAPQWNEARVRVHTNHVEHWLNGVKVLEFALDGEVLAAAIKRSRFKDLPDLMEPAERFIVLEHNGTAAFFRNPRLRLLPPPEESLLPESAEPPTNSVPTTRPE